MAATDDRNTYTKAKSEEGTAGDARVKLLSERIAVTIETLKMHEQHTWYSVTY